MSSDCFRPRVLPACGLAVLLALLLAACTLPVLPAVPAPARIAVTQPAAPPAAAASAPAAAASAPPPAPVSQNGAPALDAAVGYAERIRGLPPAELAQEVQRLGDNGYAPLRATQLALALAQSRTPANLARAQAMLQRVQADASSEAQGLQPFARWLTAQITEQRRADEAAERQGQQLRDAQRRIEQLNERLEALRAIERSLPGPARRDPAPVPR